MSILGQLGKYEMACEENSINAIAHRDVLQSFSLSETEMNVEHSFCHADMHHDSLMQ